MHFLNKQSAHFPVIFPIAKNAQEKKVLIIVSTVTIAETLRLDGPPSVDQEQIISDFFDRPFVHREAAGIFVAEKARDIRRKHHVDSADAIHLATAIITNSPFFMTYDGTRKRPLLGLDQKLALNNGQPLRIVTPEEYDEIQRKLAQPLIAMAIPNSSMPTEPPNTGNKTAT